MKIKLKALSPAEELAIDGTGSFDFAVVYVLNHSSSVVSALFPTKYQAEQYCAWCWQEYNYGKHTVREVAR